MSSYASHKKKSKTLKIVSLCISLRFFAVGLMHLKKLQLLGYHCNKQSKTGDSLVDYVLSFVLNVGSCISEIVLFRKMCDYFLMQFVLVPCWHALPGKVVESFG